MPIVSVIMPAYNARRFIDDALKSALNQTLTDVEIIVVDDGSKDDTAEHVRRNYPQVLCFTKTNGGASSARNYGMEKSTGEFIAFLDADDAWHPEKLEAQVALMRAYPDAQLCRTGLSEDPISPNTSILGRTPGAVPPHQLTKTFAESFFNPFFATSAVMIKRSAYERVGNFDTRLKVSEDVDYYLRVLVDAPIVPIVSGVALHKRPVDGSLGDDSESGYLQLIEVYRNFVNNYPQTYSILGKRVIEKTMAAMWARYAASQRRNGKRLESLRNALKSMFIFPNTLAAKVMVLALTRRT
jgi:glycosyltransferase involved in cell wall biosynthesis